MNCQIFTLMKFRSLFLFAITILLALGSCSKDKFDVGKQAKIDDATIVKYLTENSISATKHESGIYYQIIREGTGKVSYDANTSISVRYIGRLLNGKVFDKTNENSFTTKLGQLIAGWQIGIPLIQKGGKIRLFIPSGYAYGPKGAGAIPPNSVLDFDIELEGV